jgi:deazaflavin-dependent oxidoreductase (nitroreductase family)
MRTSPKLRNRATGLRRLSVAWSRLHVRLLRLSKGRLRFGFMLAGKLPVLALTTTGRKSGTKRTTPVAYLREGDAYVVIASNAGVDRPPAWLLNLQANPDCEVDAAGDRMRAHARRADPEEQRRLWARFAEENADFEAYQSYTERELVVVILEPR